MVLYLLRQLILSLINQLLDVLILLLWHLLHCHTANRTVYVLHWLQTFVVYQMSTRQTRVILGWVFQHFKANRALWFCNIFITFVVSLFWNVTTITAFMTVKEVFFDASSTHSAVILVLMIKVHNERCLSFFWDCFNKVCILNKRIHQKSFCIKDWCIVMREVGLFRIEDTLSFGLCRKPFFRLGIRLCTDIFSRDIICMGRRFYSKGLKHDLR